ncbi:MAG: hypothetical protein H0X44_07550 [Acidobacteria bacterium]|nr:hypothetical protein [Acidobacteriota bacterium]
MTFSTVGASDRWARYTRIVLFTAVGVTLTWVALVFAFGGIHFDDFVNLHESRGATAMSAEEWLKPASDGRWQPLKRLAYDALARTAGLTFWPYALALAAGHLLTAWGIASAGRAIWPEAAGGRLAGLIALASLNLSAYSLANAGTLHGILSVALSVWAVSSALHGARAKRYLDARLVLSVIATIAACLYKETGVTTPALAAYGLWLASRGRQIARLEMLRAIGAPALGVAAYFLLRFALDIGLFPSHGRYSAGGRGFSITNLVVVLAGVAPWAATALMGSIKNATQSGRAVELVAMGAAAVAMALPSLLLPWTSPNFWYATVPVVGLGTAALLLRATRPARAFSALSLLMAVVLVACTGAAWRAGAHHWGPYSKASVTHWRTFPRQGGRVVWFDRDNGASYGGLYRTIGPGDRLAHALRVATGDPSIEAVACIDLLVGPPCTVREGDEIYMHSRGRLERLLTPPPGKWYVLP